MRSNRDAVRNIKEKLNVITKKDYNDIYAYSQQGNILGYVSSNQFQDFVSVKLYALKKFFVSKFVYTGDVDKIDVDLIDEYLFQWGRVAIINYGGEYLIGNFYVSKLTYNYKPLEIKFIPIKNFERAKVGKVSGKKVIKRTDYLNKGEKFVVGENAVIIHNSPGYLVNQTKSVYTPFYKCDALLEDLGKVYNRIMLDILASRTFLTVPSDVNQKVFDSLYKAIINGSPVVKLGDVSSVGRDALTYYNSNNLLLEFKQNINALIDSFNFIWEQILTIFGGDTNANNKKREKQIEAEITVNNDFSHGINITELNYRKKGFKQLGEVFDINIECDLRSNQEKEKENDNLDIIEEGEENT